MRDKYQIMRIIQKSKKSIYKEEAVELKNLGRHCSEYLARQGNLAAVNALREEVSWDNWDKKITKDPKLY